MPVRRKVFRIEENARADAHGMTLPGNDAARDHAVAAELQALRALIEPRQAAVDRERMGRCEAQLAQAQAYKRELDIIYAALRTARQDAAGADAVVLDGTQIAHAGQELRAIVAGTEQATQSILKAAEDIDQTAGVLSAVLKSGHDQGLARDIQDRVLQIFESCNFQDLTGQRVTKVMATLTFIEEHVARLLEIWRDIERFEPVVPDDARRSEEKFLNGPKLAGAAGHSSQREVDALFSCA